MLAGLTSVMITSGQAEGPARSSSEQGSWTLRERETCLAGLQRHGEDLGRIAAFVRTKNKQQVEKYLQDRCLTRSKHLSGATAKAQAQRGKRRKSAGSTSPALSGSNCTRLPQHVALRPVPIPATQTPDGTRSSPPPASSEQNKETLLQGPAMPYSPVRALPTQQAWPGSAGGWPRAHTDIGKRHPQSHSLMPSPAPSTPLRMGSSELAPPSSWLPPLYSADVYRPPGALGPVTSPLGRHSSLPDFHGLAPNLPEASCSSMTPWNSDILQAEPHPRPDLGVVYAFLGSLFDERLKSQQLVDHEQLLRDLGPSDRTTLHQLLHNLIHGLGRPDTVHRFAQVAQASGSSQELFALQELLSAGQQPVPAPQAPLSHPL